MSDLVLKVPKRLRRGHSRWKEQTSVAEGVELIELICRNFALDDLGHSSVLDMGCGSKLVQAILDRNLPLGRYVGVDIFPELIEFLETNVTDPRFSFKFLNTHNAMYNPAGEPLTAQTRLSLDEQGFDIICLFSVFTHLAPHDYVAMLKMLRRYVKPSGRLIFSLFVNEPTAGGLGFMDSFLKNLTGKDAQIQKHSKLILEAVATGGPPEFLDFYPAQPLKVAMYSREHALRLVEDTGWEVIALQEPEKIIQHYMICQPA